MEKSTVNTTNTKRYEKRLWSFYINKLNNILEIEGQSSPSYEEIEYPNRAMNEETESVIKKIPLRWLSV